MLVELYELSTVACHYINIYSLISMAFEKAYAAMERNDWNIVTKMLEKDELSSEDFFKKQLDDVRYL
jgi:hypothetical protein